MADKPMKYKEILDLVRREVRMKPEAVRDFLDALVLSMNDLSEKAAEDGQEGPRQAALWSAAFLDRAKHQVNRVLFPWR